MTALVVVIMALAAADGAPADAQTEAPPEPPVVADPLSALGLGDAVGEPLVDGATLFAPLVSGGVVVIDVADAAAPRMRVRLLEGRAVLRVELIEEAVVVFATDGAVLAFSRSVPHDAMPLPASVATALTSPTSPTSPAPPATNAAAVVRVLEVRGQLVVIGAGRSAGFIKGVTVRVFAQRSLVPNANAPGAGQGEVTATLRIDDADATRSVATLSEGDAAFVGDAVKLSPEVATGTVIDVPWPYVVIDAPPDWTVGRHIAIRSADGSLAAIVRIDRIEGGRATAKLGVGDVAAAGDRVERYSDASELTAHRFIRKRFWSLPPRAPFALRVWLKTRGAIGMQPGVPPGTPTQGAAFVELGAKYYFASLPIAVTAELSPVGFGILSTTAHYPSAGTVTVAYSEDFIEAGLGAGVMLGSPGPCFSSPDFTFLTCEDRSGVSINQAFRVGAVDGLHLELATSIVVRSGQTLLVDGQRSELQQQPVILGMVRAELDVPLTSTLRTFFAGGIGHPGWAFAEGGAHWFVAGTGAPGTVVLSGALGASGMLDGPGQDVQGFTTSVIGPSATLGAELRF